ncbi:uncharacterized protein F5891DRAFT_143496 [Suillus fuscotomentosus]|uniref:Uncharacterized protein n=1 Tax=Suillus fuscotomentosus TaxID=1912939 RepID=A0AAD4EAH3_9AGAM|nr:uncharacterized protein F5891DRAFT_143496 [Suillus fuscotomentosus]KAG1902585.1 hypothetical protein F5891DRAFT_143496 [Suillus fuscotomentosus]
MRMIVPIGAIIVVYASSMSMQMMMRKSKSNQRLMQNPTFLLYASISVSVFDQHRKNFERYRGIKRKVREPKSD